MRPPYALGSCLLLLFSLSCAPGSSVNGSGEPGSVQPTNVILFVAPDVGLTLGCYGVEGVQTPRLDMLSRVGVRFEHVYAASSAQAASRVALLTGQMPVHHGAVQSWGDLFGDAGYRTGLIGELGVEGSQGLTFDYRSPAYADAAIRGIQWHRDALDEFLSQGDNSPWALVVCLQDSRRPFPTDGAPFGNAALPPHRPEQVNVPVKLVDTLPVREEIKRYYDGIRRMDAMLGAIVDRLAAKGQSQHTVGLFTSDSGLPFPFAKETLFENGIRVPLIAWGRGIEQGAVRPQYFAHVDVLPTLLKIASQSGGMPPIDESLQASFDGISFDYFLSAKQALEEQGRSAPAWRSHVCATLPAQGVDLNLPSRAVRFGRWKYIRNGSAGQPMVPYPMQESPSWQAISAAAEGGDASVQARMTSLLVRPKEELFDLAEDPHELTNLAPSPAHQQQLAEGRTLIANSPWLAPLGE